jgi:hypothetical protein
MSFDVMKAAARAKHDVDVPWDELRAARVHKNALAAFEAGKNAPEESDDEPAPEETIPMVSPMRRNVALLVALAAVAALLALFFRMRGGEEDFVASTLHYRDGSRSLMSAQAQVHVLEDTSSLVAVEQSAGKVRYDITRRPERHFVVHVDGVTITVLGTVFDVDIQGERVAVAVERGRVRVETDGRKVEITAGEHVTVKRGEAPASETDDTDVQVVDESLEEVDTKGIEVPPPEEGPEGATAPAPSASTAPSAAEWMSKADAARAAGVYEGALRALRALIQAHPTDGRATLALFTIGKVERKRGHHAAAARAFEQCGPALEGDAIAEAAASWQAAGKSARARAAARRYLQTYPKGVHAEAMRGLTGD